eukprot:765857-Hanusia_phi.AAC.5
MFWFLKFGDDQFKTRSFNFWLALDELVFYELKKASLSNGKYSRVKVYRDDTIERIQEMSYELYKGYTDQWTGPYESTMTVILERNHIPIKIYEDRDRPVNV